MFFYVMKDFNHYRNLFGKKKGTFRQVTLKFKWCFWKPGLCTGLGRHEVRHRTEATPQETTHLAQECSSREIGLQDVGTLHKIIRNSSKRELLQLRKPQMRVDERFYGRLGWSEKLWTSGFLRRVCDAVRDLCTRHVIIQPHHPSPPGRTKTSTKAEPSMHTMCKMRTRPAHSKLNRNMKSWC